MQISAHPAYTGALLQRNVGRSVTPDMIPEPVSLVEPEEESLTIEIVKLPAKLKEVALLCWFQGIT